MTIKSTGEKPSMTEWLKKLMKKNPCEKGRVCDPNNTLCRVNGESIKCGYAEKEKTNVR